MDEKIDLRWKIAHLVFGGANIGKIGHHKFSDNPQRWFAIADDVLAIPEIAEALKLVPIKDLGMQRRD